MGEGEDGGGQGEGGAEADVQPPQEPCQGGGLGPLALHPQQGGAAPLQQFWMCLEESVLDD